MRTQLRSAAVLLAASLALTGCSSAIPAPAGSDKPSASASESAGSGASELSAMPSTGPVITGSAYTFNAPEGWSVPTQEIPNFTPDSIVADVADADGFADNMNVVKSPAGVVTADQVESAGVAELKAAGASNVTVNPRQTIAGSEAAHLSAEMSGGGVTAAMEQYYLSNDEATFVVTFSFNSTVAQADRVALAESVLASWKWS
ncbi:hypothetical protein GCM10009651_20600 [Microbacterium natoriense]|uniref:hypothetical protein n=1 Tax=Microbacterium natoriense TaxID=284570 RepID=UPI0031D69634